MKRVEEYLRRAAECDALARKAVSPEQREMITHMADTWRMLARQRRTIILSGPLSSAEEDASSAVPAAAHDPAR
jgi:hypothetical protein